MTMRVQITGISDRKRFRPVQFAKALRRLGGLSLVDAKAGLDALTIGRQIAFRCETPADAHKALAALKKLGVDAEVTES